ncbi:MAG: hypothetical protein LBT47_06080, partial [Deltaproteobacteria bacterium]|nr:hypothetical protein [Deltaproteobacteria bacterium]
KDAKKVSAIISKFFSPISYYQRANNEKTFHSFLQLVLTASGFDVQTELLGAKSRLDLCLKLPEQVYIIVELKYIPARKKPDRNKENRYLAEAAFQYLPQAKIDSGLANALRNKLALKEYRTLIQKLDLGSQTEAQADQLLAKAAEDYLTDKEQVKVLAEVMRQELPGEIEAILQAKPVNYKTADTKAQIKEKLAKATEEALNNIVDRGYHGLLGHKPKEIIDLGLAIYGNGLEVKAAFGPRRP